MLSKILKQWKTKAGLEAVAILFYQGYISGYVKIPKELENKTDHFFEENIDCHGGVPFIGTPEGIQEGQWIGFDTTYFDDGINFNIVEKELVPLMNKKELQKYQEFKRYNDYYKSDDGWKDLDYVVNECEKIAEQLKKLNKSQKKCAKKKIIKDV
jgi:hypothetical protein